MEKDLSLKGLPKGIYQVQDWGTLSPATKLRSLGVRLSCVQTWYGESNGLSGELSAHRPPFCTKGGPLSPAILSAWPVFRLSQPSCCLPAGCQSGRQQEGGQEHCFASCQTFPLGDERELKGSSGMFRGTLWKAFSLKGAEQSWTATSLLLWKWLGRRRSFLRPT